MSAPIIIIAAMSHDRIIGRGNSMPWNIPAEYAQFLKQVEGATMIMGRRSFEIFGPDLTKTQLIVVSQSLAGSEPRAVETLEKAFEIARGFGTPIFIGGGASIYALAIPRADRMHLSQIHGHFTGDTYFPEFDPADWQLESKVAGTQFDYLEYARQVKPA